jgi:hypothetical protein
MASASAKGGFRHSTPPRRERNKIFEGKAVNSDKELSEKSGERYFKPLPHFRQIPTLNTSK